ASKCCTRVAVAWNGVGEAFRKSMRPLFNSARINSSRQQWREFTPLAQSLPLPQKRFSTVKEPDEVEPETGATRALLTLVPQSESPRGEK
ncbi:hypothetical protein PSYMO_34097, partial [Pseudomonas amygdali pv. mori str. 301020]